MSKTTYSIVLSCALVTFGGCAPLDLDAEGQGEVFEEGATEGEEQEGATATASDELLSSGVYYWQQGWGSTPISGSTATQVCYLTSVTGHFEGWGESVYTFIQSGSWYLGGRSQQNDVAAQSYCALVNGHDYVQYSWSQGQGYPVNMGSSTGRVCFLTGVSGKFYGSGEWVHVYQSGGSWFLFGASQQVGVSANARCVAAPAEPTEYTWLQGQPKLDMGTTTSRSCALSFLSGKFQGWGESVVIRPENGRWTLNGRSQQHSVQARARCF